MTEEHAQRRDEKERNRSLEPPDNEYEDDSVAVWIRGHRRMTPPPSPPPTHIAFALQVPPPTHLLPQDFSIQSLLIVLRGRKKSGKREGQLLEPPLHTQVIRYIPRVPEKAARDDTRKDKEGRLGRGSFPFLSYVPSSIRVSCVTHCGFLDEEEIQKIWQDCIRCKR